MTISQTYRFYVFLIVFGGALVFISERNIPDRLRIVMAKKKLGSIRIWSLFFKILALFVLGWPLTMRDCGADRFVYYNRYVRDEFDMMDGLFDLFRNLIHKFIAEPELGIGIIGAICLITAMVAIASCRDEIEVHLSWFAFLAALYFYYYNYVRMMCAATLVIVACTYMIKEKNKMAIICLIVASWFHLSAVTVLFVYVTMQYFVRYWRLFIAVVIIATGAFVYDPIFFLSVVKVDRYASQIVHEIVSEASIGIGTLLKILPIFLIQLYYLKRFKHDKVYRQLFILSLVNIGVSMMGYFVGVASRFATMYFVSHILFMIPWIIKRLDSQRERIYLRILFIAYMFFYYYFVSLNFETMMIVPYS